MQNTAKSLRWRLTDQHRGVSCRLSMILVRVAVEHLQSADDVCWLKQVPAGIGLLRAGANGHRVHMVLRQVELLKGTEHI